MSNIRAPSWPLRYSANITSAPEPKPIRFTIARYFSRSVSGVLRDRNTLLVNGSRALLRPTGPRSNAALHSPNLPSGDTRESAAEGFVGPRRNDRRQLLQVLGRDIARLPLLEDCVAH